MNGFEATNSVFKITDENISVSICISGDWNSKSTEKTIDERNNLLELRSQKHNELHVEQLGRKWIILINDNALSRLTTFKNELVEELKSVKYTDLEYMVYRFQLTYDELIDVLDLK